MPRALADLVQRCLAKAPDGPVRVDARPRAGARVDPRHDDRHGRRGDVGGAGRCRVSDGPARWRCLPPRSPCWRSPGSGSAAAGRPASPRGAAARRVAVLPFRDLTGTPKGTLIGEGFAETVSARLGSDRDVAVLPAAAIDETADDLDALVRRTGAQAIVRGSLQFEGDRVRATFAVLEPDGVQTRGGQGRGFDRTPARPRGRSGAARGGRAGPRAGRDPRARRSSPTSRPTASSRRSGTSAATKTRPRWTPRSRSWRSSAARLGSRPRWRAPISPSAPSPGTASWAERAIEAGRRAAELEPTLGSVRETRGRIELLLDRPDKAAAEFRQALAAQPNSVEAQLGLASALERQGLADRRGGGLSASGRDPAGVVVDLQSSGRLPAPAGVVRRGRSRASGRRCASRPTTPGRSTTWASPTSNSAGTRRRSRSIGARSRSGRPPPRSRTSGPASSSSPATTRRLEAYERATALQPENAVLWLNFGDALRLSGHGGERTESRLPARDRSARGRPRGDAARRRPPDQPGARAGVDRPAGRRPEAGRGRARDRSRGGRHALPRRTRPAGRRRGRVPRSICSPARSRTATRWPRWTTTPSWRD